MSATTRTQARPVGRPVRIGSLGSRGLNLARKVVAYTLLSLGGLAMMAPFFWLVSSSLKGPAEIFVLPPKWIPDPVRWHNYVDVMTKLPFALYLKNTLTITVFALLGQVTTACVSAFSFARLRWPGRDFFFRLILATIMLPGVVTMIPVFIMFKEIGWLDTFYPLIVPAYFGGGAFSIFLLRQFFLTLPMELDEAARIDGAGSLHIFSRLVVPLSRPAITVVAIFSFLGHWNEFLGPLIYLNSANKRTLAIGIYALQGLEWGRDQTQLVMAVSVIMITPIILLFFVAQNVFIQGIVLTGIKA